MSEPQHALTRRASYVRTEESPGETSGSAPRTMLSFLNAGSVEHILNPNNPPDTEPSSLYTTPTMSTSRPGVQHHSMSRSTSKGPKRMSFPYLPQTPELDLADFSHIPSRSQSRYDGNLDEDYLHRRPNLEPYRQRSHDRYQDFLEASGRQRSASYDRPRRRSSIQNPELDLTELVAPAPYLTRSRDGGLERNLEAGDIQDHDENAPEPRETRFETLTFHLFTTSYLIFFSIFGTLARLGLQWLTFYPSAPTVIGVLWANFAGSLVMGFLVEDRMLFREAQGHPSRVPSPNSSQSSPSRPKALFRSRSRMNDMRADAFKKLKKSIPLYIGLTTGFCGSFTSFSSFMRDTFLSLSNDLATPYNHPVYHTPEPMNAPGPPVARSDGDSFMAVCGVIILTISLSLAALRVGAHLALALEHVPFPLHIFGSETVRKIIDYTVPVLGLGSWLGAILLAVFPPDRPGGPDAAGSSWASETWRGHALLACCWAPLGCLARYYASLCMNPLLPRFPLGTFTVNMFGTAVLGMAWNLQRVKLFHAGGQAGVVGGGRLGCQLLQGVMDGFCGALTTVSTWVVELDGLSRWHAWVYGTTSVTAGLGFLVSIMGSVRWSVGWSTPMCSM